MIDTPCAKTTLDHCGPSPERQRLGLDVLIKHAIGALSHGQVTTVVIGKCGRVLEPAGRQRNANVTGVWNQSSARKRKVVEASVIIAFSEVRWEKDGKRSPCHFVSPPGRVYSNDLRLVLSRAGLTARQEGETDRQETLKGFHTYEQRPPIGRLTDRA